MLIIYICHVFGVGIVGYFVTIAIVIGLILVGVFIFFFICGVYECINCMYNGCINPKVVYINSGEANANVNTNTNGTEMSVAEMSVVDIEK